MARCREYAASGDGWGVLTSEHVQHLGQDERRELFGALLEADGWSWDDVPGADQRSKGGS